MVAPNDNTDTENEGKKMITFADYLKQFDQEKWRAEALTNVSQRKLLDALRTPEKLYSWLFEFKPCVRSIDELLNDPPIAELPAMINELLSDKKIEDINGAYFIGLIDLHRRKVDEIKSYASEVSIAIVSLMADIHENFGALLESIHKFSETSEQAKLQAAVLVAFVCAKVIENPVGLEQIEATTKRINEYMSWRLHYGWKDYQTIKE